MFYKLYYGDSYELFVNIQVKGNFILLTKLEITVFIAIELSTEVSDLVIHDI